ncbi:MAG: IS5 family transposase [Inquilinus sp.]|nr:IS5 family transposase [Inquilinus sp.]
MRGEDARSEGLFSYVSCEARVPSDHPLRSIRAMVDEALEVLSPAFERLYSKVGRPSIPPEKLLRALLLQAFFSIRSERQLMEQLDYNLLFRWFVGLPMDAAVWDASVFSKNRDRLLEGDIAAQFMAAVLNQKRVRALLSQEHFSVDGTLIEAWASMKSFRPKDRPDDGPPAPGRNAERDFKGEKRSNETHASTTDPDARLYRKGDGQSSRLCFMGHLLMENRNGLIVDTALTPASGTAEREAALALIERRPKRRITLGADKAYDVSGFVADLRARKVTPHIAIDGHVTKTGKRRKTAIDRRTTRHPGYAISQRIRKRIEEGFGWIKTTGGLAKTQHRGVPRVGWMFTFTAAAYNLIRIPKLLAMG